MRPLHPTVRFTINASAGAGGTISPAGFMSVACGGSQTYTIQRYCMQSHIGCIGRWFIGRCSIQLYVQRCAY
jgi:hypothetical protein